MMMMMMMMMMINCVKGFAVFEAIAKVDGVDALFVGPSDLSASMGSGSPGENCWGWKLSSTVGWEAMLGWDGFFQARASVDDLAVGGIFM